MPNELGIFRYCLPQRGEHRQLVDNLIDNIHETYMHAIGAGYHWFVNEEAPSVFVVAVRIQ